MCNHYAKQTMYGLVDCAKSKKTYKNTRPNVIKTRKDTASTGQQIIKLKTQSIPPPLISFIISLNVKKSRYYLTG